MNNLHADQADFKEPAIELSSTGTEPTDVRQSLLREEQDDDEDDDNFVDICVADTQQFSSIPPLSETVGEAPPALTSDLRSMDASACSASTTFSASNQSGNVGEKIVDSLNHDCPIDKGVQEPDPSQCSPSPSPFHFPYTSDSVCGTPLNTENRPSHSVTRINASAEMAAESQSSCTEFSQRGARARNVPLSQPEPADPEFDDQDITESQLSQRQSSQQRPSSIVAAGNSLTQTIPKSIAEESAAIEKGDYSLNPSPLSFCLSLSPSVPLRLFLSLSVFLCGLR